VEEAKRYHLDIVGVSCFNQEMWLWNRKPW